MSVSAKCVLALMSRERNDKFKYEPAHDSFSIIKTENDRSSLAMATYMLY